MYDSVTLIDQDICKVQARPRREESGKLQQVPWQSGLEEAEDEEAATCARWGKCAQATVTNACQACMSRCGDLPSRWIHHPASPSCALPSPLTCPLLPGTHLRCPSCLSSLSATTVSAPSEGAPVSFVPGSSPRAQNTSPQLVNVQ